MLRQVIKLYVNELKHSKPVPAHSIPSRLPPRYEPVRECVEHITPIQYHLYAAVPPLYIIELHLEYNEGESLDTAYGPTGFSAFMRPRANMYVAR